MTVGASVSDFAGGDVERGVQVEHAVALVVVLWRAARPCRNGSGSCVRSKPGGPVDRGEAELEAWLGGERERKEAAE